MRHIVAFLGSLAVGLLMAAAGLYFDVKTLTLAGIILFGLAAVLWLYEWGRTAPRRPASAPVRHQPDDQPPPLNEKRPDLSNTTLQAWKARRFAKAALAERHGNIEANVARMESALTSMRRTFGVETPEATGNGRSDLRLWIDYFEVVWPFIEGGNYEEAKARAERFIAERQPQSS